MYEKLNNLAVKWLNKCNVSMKGLVFHLDSADSQIECDSKIHRLESITRHRPTFNGCSNWLLFHCVLSVEKIFKHLIISFT